MSAKIITFFIFFLLGGCATKQYSINADAEEIPNCGTTEELRDRILAKVEKKLRKPNGSGNKLSATVSIKMDNLFKDSTVEIKDSSENSAYDQSVLNAVRDAQVHKILSCVAPSHTELFSEVYVVFEYK